jgi:hypothetical protein
MSLRVTSPSSIRVLHLSFSHIQLPLRPRLQMSDVASALQKLASYRAHNTRASQEIFDHGLLILKTKNAVANMGDEGMANHISNNPISDIDHSVRMGFLGTIGLGGFGRWQN